jgi:hypothetical protein
MLYFSSTAIRAWSDVAVDLVMDPCLHTRELVAMAPTQFALTCMSTS